MNVLRLSILSVLIFSLSPMTALAHWHSGYSHDSTIDTSNPDWMASIADSRSLSMLSIPGAHRTMSRSGVKIGQCHSTPLSELLESGIRVIDIRARNSFNRFDSLWHENARLVNVDEYDEGHIWYEYGRDVLSPVIAFLTAHPSETVLIRLKRELGDEEIIKLIESRVT